MSVPLKFVLQQGPVLRGMGEAAWAGLRQRLGSQLDGRTSNGSSTSASTRTPVLPGPELQLTLPARDDELVRSYVQHVGGDPALYYGHIPGHLFPQWAFALSGKLTEGLNYPLLAAMNGGCRLTLNAPLPAGEPLTLTGRLENIDDNGRRAILTQRFVTGTAAVPDAVVADLFVYVPLQSRNKEKDKAERDRAERDRADGESREARAASRLEQRAKVPTDASEVASWNLGPNAGLDFAKLTGDFNPVHWVPFWARAFGFRSTILHGFGTLARAIEGLNRGVFAGDVAALREVEVRFTRPLVLPASVGLYVRDDRLWVGDSPGGAAYLEGRFSRRSP